MNDHLKTQRSYTMSQIKSTGSSIEDMLCKELWHRGLRYRKNVANITGKPDIVFRKARVVVFCDGEFWHGYNWSEKKPKIKTNRDYWIPKIEKNIERDKVVNEALIAEGWLVIRFWEKQIKNNLTGCADIVEGFVRDRL